MSNSKDERAAGWFQMRAKENDEFWDDVGVLQRTAEGARVPSMSDVVRRAVRRDADRARRRDRRASA